MLARCHSVLDVSRVVVVLRPILVEAEAFHDLVTLYQLTPTNSGHLVVVNLVHVEDVLQCASNLRQMQVHVDYAVKVNKAARLRSKIEGASYHGELTQELAVELEDCSLTALRTIANLELLRVKVDPLDYVFHHGYEARVVLIVDLWNVCTVDDVPSVLGLGWELLNVGDHGVVEGIEQIVRHQHVRIKQDHRLSKVLIT